MSQLSSQSCVYYDTDQAIGANHLTFIVENFYLINIQKRVFKEKKVSSHGLEQLYFNFTIRL